MSLAALARRAAPALPLALLLPAALAAQAPLGLDDVSAGGGLEFRRYAFESGFAVDETRQVAVPIAVALPLGRRFTVDIGSAWATTTVEGSAGDFTVSGFTDTQVRASYTFGADAVVASVLVNLPTGLETNSVEDFFVASAVASNFLLFPVNVFGTGTSVTGGLAGVTRAGAWNLGAAASVRWNAEFDALTAGATTLRYEPGLEGRVRLGADRIVGRSRLTLGVTASTFGDDQFSGAGVLRGRYAPGNRLIGEVAFTAPLGTGSLTLFAWDYYRSAGDTDGTALDNKENILALGAGASLPLGGRLSLDPGLDTRFWSPEEGSGWLIGGQVGLRVPLGDRGAAVPTVRYERGSLTTVDDSDFTVNGLGLSLYLRYSL